MRCACCHHCLCIPDLLLCTPTSMRQMRLYREDAEEVLATAVESLQDKMPLVVIKAGQSYVS